MATINSSVLQRIAPNFTASSIKDIDHSSVLSSVLLRSSSSFYSSSSLCCSYNKRRFPSLSLPENSCHGGCSVMASLPPSPGNVSVGSTKLYVSGLSFRTTEDKLRNAFESFGQLVEVNLMMDKIVNRPRGFAFLRYTTEKESKKAIEGMHGKFLDGRVIFVEFAKPRSRAPPPRDFSRARERI